MKSGGSGGSTAAKASTSNQESNTAAPGSATVPSNIASGQTGGFNPLSDLTSARYAGFTNLPSADMFGPDGGLTNMPNQDDMLGMLENPIFSRR